MRGKVRKDEYEGSYIELKNIGYKPLLRCKYCKGKEVKNVYTDGELHNDRI